MPATAERRMNNLENPISISKAYPLVVIAPTCNDPDTSSLTARKNRRYSESTYFSY